MKKLKLLIYFTSILLCIGSTTYAGDRTKGGDGVDQNSGVILRDLFEKQCMWEKGPDFAKKLSYLPELLNRIKNLNLYFSFLLTDEIKNVVICPYEGNLTQVNTEDSNKVTVFNFQKQKIQLALRWQNKIWISMPNFRKLSDPKGQLTRPQIQAYLFVHELTHSFIPDETPFRNEKVKSVVSSIVNSKSSSEFEYQLSQNNVTPIFTNQTITDITDRFKKSNYLTSLDELKKTISAIRLAQMVYKAGSLTYDLEDLKNHIMSAFDLNYINIQCSNVLNKKIDTADLFSYRDPSTRYHLQDAMWYIESCFIMKNIKNTSLISENFKLHPFLQNFLTVEKFVEYPDLIMSTYLENFSGSYSLKIPQPEIVGCALTSYDPHKSVLPECTIARKRYEAISYYYDLFENKKIRTPEVIKVIRIILHIQSLLDLGWYRSVSYNWDKRGFTQIDQMCYRFFDISIFEKTPDFFKFFKKDIRNACGLRS